MKKIVLSLILLIMISTAVFGMGEPPKNGPSSEAYKVFDKKLDKVGLVFNMPLDFTETPYVENSQVGYDYAIKHKDQKLEIRYKIDPAEMFGSNEKFNNKPAFEMMFFAIGMNIFTENNKTSFFEDLDSMTLKEFRADRGIRAWGENRTDFGTGYKNCVVIGLHKDNHANVYIFYLFDDLDWASEYIGRRENYFSLRFK